MDNLILNIVNNLCNNVLTAFVLSKGIGKDPYQSIEKYVQFTNALSGLKISEKIARLFAKKLLQYNILDFSSKNVFNPKAVGLGLSAISRLIFLGELNTSDYLELIVHLTDKLKKYGSSNTNYIGWGFPFTWYSEKVIPPWTPVTSVTSYVGHGLLEIYAVTGYHEALNLYLKSINFFANKLKVVYQDDEKLCFSYSPIDKMMVHNTNLMVAEHLLIGYITTGKRAFLDKSLKAVNFTINEIDRNGALCYYSKLYKRTCYQDFHAAFEINSLSTIYSLLKDNIDDIRLKIKDALLLRSNYLEKNMIDPKHFIIYKIIKNKKISTIQDSRSFAAIISALLRSTNFRNVNTVLIKGLLYRMYNLLWDSRKKIFMYRYYMQDIYYRDHIRYIRMSVSWPLFMLAELMLYLHGKYKDYYQFIYNTILRNINY